MGTESFPGVKRLGRGIDHPPPSSTEVKERVDIPLLPSGPPWRLLGWTLPLPLPPAYNFTKIHPVRTETFHMNGRTWRTTAFLELLLQTGLEGKQKQVAVYTGSAKTGKKNYTTKEECTNSNGAENWCTRRQTATGIPRDVSISGQTCGKHNEASEPEPPLVVRHFVPAINFSAVIPAVTDGAARRAALHSIASLTQWITAWNNP